jgi:hypothetical protein
MRQHIDILGWLFIAMGGLGVLVAIMVFAVLGLVGGLSGDLKSAALLSSIGLFVAVFVAILCVPNFIAGWGLLKRKSWSRILALVLGCLGLLSFPLGTALGIYALWTLTKPEVQQILSS